jgi:hypothetical protein
MSNLVQILIRGRHLVDGAPAGPTAPAQLGRNDSGVAAP